MLKVGAPSEMKGGEYQAKAKTELGEEERDGKSKVRGKY